MPEMIEYLRIYCKGSLEDSENHGRDWALGAICFALSIDLITSDEFKALLQEFLVPPGSMQRSLNCSEGKAWEEAEQ